MQLIAKKRHSIRERLDSVAQRKNRRVPAEAAVVEQDRMPGRGRRLKASDHFAGMQGIALLVRVAGNHQCRRVGDSAADLVIRGIPGQSGEIVPVLGGPVLVSPGLGVVKQMVTKHVEQRDQADNRPK